MNAGYGWTKTTEDKKTYISISLDEIFGAWFPFLNKIYITLWHIPKEERKSENSPNWVLKFGLKKDKQQNEQTEEVPF